MSDQPSLSSPEAESRRASKRARESSSAADEQSDDSEKNTPKRVSRTETETESTPNRPEISAGPSNRSVSSFRIEKYSEEDGEEEKKKIDDEDEDKGDKEEEEDCDKEKENKEEEKDCDREGKENEEKKCLATNSTPTKPSSDSKNVEVEAAGTRTNDEPCGADADEARDEKSLANLTCSICLGPPSPLVVTKCGHIACGGCLTASLASNQDSYIFVNPHRGPDSNRGKCPVCRAVLTGGWGVGMRGAILKMSPSN